MRTDLLRQLERRVAIDPADFNAIQQLVNLSLRVGWTYRNKSLKVWINGVHQGLDYRSRDLGLLGIRLIPKFVELIDGGRPDELSYVARQLSRMGPGAKAAIPSLVNALSESFDKYTDLQIMRCLGDIGCNDDLVDLGIELSCDSDNSLLHFEAMKTLLKIDPKRFIQRFRDWTVPDAWGTKPKSGETIDDRTFRELSDLYQQSQYWSERFKSLKTIIKLGQEHHIESALSDLTLFIESEPGRYQRAVMFNALLPVAHGIVDLLPAMIKQHCEVWAREPVNVHRGNREHTREMLRPLLLRIGPIAIDHLLDYLDNLIEQHQKAVRGYRETAQLLLSTIESLRILQDFSVELVPAMARHFNRRKSGLNLRHLAKMRSMSAAPDIVVDAISMSLVVLAFSGSQRTRANAIECLGLFQTREGLAGPALALIIKEEPDGKARRMAISNLHGMRAVAQTAFVSLLECVRVGTDNERIAVAAILVELGWVNAALLTTLSNILQSFDEKKSLKRGICNVVARLGPRATALRPELELLSKNFHVSLRHAAQRALNSLDVVKNP